MAGEPAVRGRPFLAKRLADSPDLRQRVAAARALGISLKRFDGWQPAKEIVHEYDEQGRLVRSRTVREAEWDEQQQAYMLALARCESLTCPGCGGWLPETTTHEAEAYEVPPPMRCGRCTRIGIAQERHAKDHTHMHATRWGATLRR